MWMYRKGDILNGGAHLYRESRLADEVRCFRARYLDPQNQPIGHIGDSLDKAFGLSGGEGPPEGREGEPVLLHGVTGGNRPRLGQPGRRYLGVCEDGVRNGGPLSGRRQPRRRLGRDDPLLEGFVRQQRRAPDIADRVDPNDVGHHALVGFYETTLIRLDSYRREVQLLSPRLSPDAQKKLLGFQADHASSGIDLRDERGLHLLDGRDPRFQVDFPSSSLEVLLHQSDEVRVRSGEELLSEFHDGYPAAQLLIHAREFHPHHTPSHHEELIRRRGEFQRLLGADDNSPVEGDPRKLRGTSSGRDHDPLRLHLLHPLLRPHHDLLPPSDLRLAHDELDAVPLAEGLDARDKLGYHLRLPLLKSRVIYPRPVDQQTKLLSLLDFLVELRDCYQRLGGDASRPEALAAEPLLLYQQCPET